MQQRNASPVTAAVGLLTCGTCGRRMESAWSNGKPAYRCRHGHTRAVRPDPARPGRATLSTVASRPTHRTARLLAPSGHHHLRAPKSGIVTFSSTCVVMLAGIAGQHHEVLATAQGRVGQSLVRRDGRWSCRAWRRRGPPRRAGRWAGWPATVRCRDLWRGRGARTGCRLPGTRGGSASGRGRRGSA